MTEKLQQLMHERAATPDFAAPDLAGLRSAGRRRRRRQRVVVAGGGVVATAAVAALAVAVVQLVPGSGSGPDAASDPSGDPVSPTAASYATGTVIHDDGRVVDVGHPVRAYVATTVGYVTADGAGRVWSVTDDGVEQVGITTKEDLRLVTEPGGSVVAWLDSDSPAVVAFDQADGDLRTYDVRLDAPGVPDGVTQGYLYALSDGALYVRDGRDALAVGLETGEETMVVPAVREGSDVLDAAAGRVLLTTGDGTRVARATYPPADLGPVLQLSFEDVLLSPDADFVAVSEDEGEVLDTATGEPVSLDLDGFYEPYGWWDDTTIGVITGSAPDGSGAVRLLGCDVTTGSCRVGASDLGTFEELGSDGGFALPAGTT